MGLNTYYSDFKCNENRVRFEDSKLGGIKAHIRLLNCVMKNAFLQLLKLYLKCELKDERKLCCLLKVMIYLIRNCGFRFNFFCVYEKIW